MRLVKGMEILEEERYMAWHECVRLLIPRPPSLAGKARRARVSSLRGGLPISAGMKIILMHSSSGLSNVVTSGMERHRKENLWTKP